MSCRLLHNHVYDWFIHGYTLAAYFYFRTGKEPLFPVAKISYLLSRIGKWSQLKKLILNSCSFFNCTIWFVWTHALDFFILNIHKWSKGVQRFPRGGQAILFSNLAFLCQEWPFFPLKNVTDLKTSGNSLGRKYNPVQAGLWGFVILDVLSVGVHNISASWSFVVIMTNSCKF